MMEDRPSPRRHVGITDTRARRCGTDLGSRTLVAMSPTDLAEQYGLTPSSARPTLPAYIKELWSRRYFISSFAKSRGQAQYSNSLMGQLWQVVTPLLNAGVYLLIFGLILRVDRGVDNYIVFLVAGIFVFTYSQRTVASGSRAISGNLSLIRALHFPRGVLPICATVVELRQLLVSTVVLMAIVVVTPIHLIGDQPLGPPEPITFAWLLLIPALLLQTLFNLGLSFIFARLGSRTIDLQQLLPFALRVWLYASGVIFPIEYRMAGRVPDWAIDLMMANPAAVYIEIVRDALMVSHEAPSLAWPLAGMWAVVAFVAGFIYFWRAEEKYGRG